MTTLSANHYWRITAAGISYTVFAVGALLPGLYVFCLALFPIDPKIKQNKTRKLIQRLCRFYVGFMQTLGLLSYQVDHPHAKDYKGHLVISNHSMLIDALFIMAYVGDLCCVVKNDLCRNPITRLPIRLAGYIPNNHERLIELAKEKLDAGENLLIFPEGTRNQTDLQLEFRRGAANIAVVSQALILPITICSVPRTVQKGEKWYQLPSKKSRIHIAIMPALELPNCIDTAKPRTLQYRHLTEYFRDYYRQSIETVLQQLKH